MYKLAKTLTGVLALTLLSSLAHAQDAKKFPGIGRTATPAEVAAWDIDVRPDFKGIPKGSGTAEQGQELWEAKCASCHGEFPAKNVQVDHILPVIDPTTGFTTWDSFVENLYCEKDNLQVLCTQCHDIKTKMEKHEAKSKKLR